ncbi:MAG: MotA/TolQ/ExbB proton channel family protein [Bacteroidales bacterium]|nr:MotA/TolQ/ExbB proton channel family protein [Bacteroidales bacterium]MBQ5855819.1 MotA/TolQ/ExbB proton channel family protein [Bacteroidales bacterium]
MNLLSILIQATNVAAAPEAEEIRLSLLELAKEGGWIMVVLAIFSIIAVYIFCERFITINKASKRDDNFMNLIRNFMIEGKLEEAKDLCKQTDTSISRMIEKGISRIGKPLNDIQTAIENVGNVEVSKLEKGVALIGMISGAAPMLGFLGTVTGMIRAFYDMSMAGNNIDIELLSAGIYEAMVTTVGGLFVGILAYIFYNIIVAKIDKVVNILESKSIEFMDVLNEPV